MNKDNIKFGKHTERWYAFDFIKGLLVIFVFMGHIIPGVSRETFPRYVIYSFHMPLFIGISGFLTNIENFNMSLKKLFDKYWKRMGLPWVIAVICFFIVNCIISKYIFSITYLDVLRAFCHPYYHLWYIMGIVSYFLVTYFLWNIFKMNKFKWIWIFIIVSVISVISKWDFFNGKINNIYVDALYRYIQFDFRLFNLPFFVLGIYCRLKYEQTQKILSDKMVEVMRILMCLSFISVTILFYFSYPNVEIIMFYVMNFFILFVVFYDCVNSNLPRSVVLEYIGKYSLPIYLYHVFIKIFCEYFFTKGSETYYITSIFLFIISCILIFYLRKVPFINEKIFGSTSSNLCK